VERLEVFPHVADFNQIFYDPRLFGGADYVLTSSAVRGRFEADPERYAVQNRFYALLDSTAEVSARFRARPGRGGPEIVIYRMGERVRRAIAAHGPLDPLWWAEYVPNTYRLRAESRLEPWQRTGGAVRDADGEPAAWVRTLDRIFTTRFGITSFALAVELMQHGRAAEARRLADAVLAMEPGNPEACLVYAMAAQALGNWDEARRALERTLLWLERAGGTSLALRLEHASVLAHQGEVERARAELESLIETRDPYAAGEARRRLGELGEVTAGAK
jgi:tetratricopeptide (TPR) repeat protein